MATHKVQARRVGLGAVVAVAAALLAATGPAGADVGAVQGSAFGYHAFNLTLFGGAQPEAGPNPVVTLAPDASNSPQTQSVTTSLISADVATLLTTDNITVTTSGALGPNGFVQSQATLTNVNKATTQPAATGSEIITADSISSKCRVTESGVDTANTGTTITNGTLQIDPGTSTIPANTITLPANPAPNTKFAGFVRPSPTAFPDRFVVVLNEQIMNPDGSITVNAVHEYFGATLDANNNIVRDPAFNGSATGGSRLQGDLILGQVVCGVTVVQGTTTTSTTTAPATTTSTTTAPATTTSTTTAPATTTSTTTAPATTTSTTTAPATTTSTTTAPATTTSTTTAPATTTSTTTAPATTTSTTTAPATTTSTTTAPATTTSTTAAPATTTSTTTAPTTSTTLAPPGTTTTTTSPFQDLLRQIVCPILQRLSTVPFFGPFIRAFLSRFGCI